MIVYRLVQLAAKVLRRPFVRLDVRGLENIPEEGPFILVSNHQSYADPILLQAEVRRPMHTMTKSTQFNDPFTGAILKRIWTFPVRRFEVDPQAVRLTLRYLRAGEGVGIYVEGERSWDGRLQPPRLGTIRLILKAGVPVIPCGISGAYDVWPRWSRPRRGTVRIRIGPPLRFPRLDNRQQRDAAVPEARERLMTAIAELAEVERAGG